MKVFVFQASNRSYNLVKCLTHTSHTYKWKQSRNMQIADASQIFKKNYAATNYLQTARILRWLKSS